MLFRSLNRSEYAAAVRDVLGLDIDPTSLLPADDEANGFDNKRMTRFLEPADVKGTVSLLVEHSDKDDDIWIFLPSVKKVRRLISSNKKDSFVGTDFSYGDVIGHKVKEWTHNLLKEEDADGKPCYVIESLPKDSTIKANTGYSKRVTWIQKDNFRSEEHTSELQSH